MKWLNAILAVVLKLLGFSHVKICMILLILFEEFQKLTRANSVFQLDENTSTIRTDTPRHGDTMLNTSQLVSDTSLIGSESSVASQQARIKVNNPVWTRHGRVESAAINSRSRDHSTESRDTTDDVETELAHALWPN